MDAIVNLKNEEKSLIKRCLSGTATDSELQQFETLMREESSAVSEFANSLVEYDDDSMLETINQFSKMETDEISSYCENDKQLSRAISGLVERIQKLAPKKKINQEEIDRILAKSLDDKSIGKIDRFEIVEYLASGGMGIVFKAIDPTLDRFVCIKVLNPRLASNIEAKTRFERETKSAAKLRNERIVMVLEVGEHRDLPFFVMQLLDGETLRSKMNSGPIDAELSRRFVIQIAEGLRHAHSLGILHRDIKPENIWITPENNVKLLDFGLAQIVNESANLTHTGTIIGTPAYMSPEQVKGHEVDQRSDLFSLGTIFYEMQTGASLFNKPNLFSTMMSVANDEVDFGADENLKSQTCHFVPVIKSLLEKNPADRIQTASALIEVLSPSVDSIDDPNSFAFDNAAVPVAKAKQTKQHDRQKTNDAATNGPTIVSRLFSGIAGAAILLLGMVVYQMTDKGTLVVEASSDVEVKIKNEVVKILDPKTGKSYEIRIGANPLPSGVYQLESTHPDSDLVFSSNVIAIQRGAKQLVKVELRPANPKPSIASKDNANVKPNASAAKNAKQAAPKQFSLSDLPTLDKQKLSDIFEFSDEQPFFKNGIVSKPPKLATVSTWTIEPTKRSIRTQCPISVSSDGKRFAFADRQNWIRIWSDTFELEHLLPSIGTVSQIEWSNDGMHFVALCESEGKKKMILWRIASTHAEVVRVIPTIGEKLRWTESDRYLVVGVDAEKKAEIHDLSQSTLTKRFVGVIGKFHDAAEFGNSILIASIHNNVGQLMNVDSQTVSEVMEDIESLRFLTGKRMGPELAIQTKEGWKIWSAASKDTRSPSNFEQNDMRERLSADGKHFIKLSADGYVMTLNTVNQKASSFQIKLPQSENWRFRHSGKAFAWSRDGSTAVFQFNQKIYIGKLLNNGQFQWSSQSLFSEPVGWSDANILDDGNIFFSIAKSDDGIESYFQHGIYRPGGKPFLNQEKFARLFHQLPSPNGKWFAANRAIIAAPENPSGFNISSGDKINIYSLVNKELDHHIQLPAPAYDYYWTADSKHLVIQRQNATSKSGMAIISGRNGDPNFKNAEHIYSIAEKKLITLIPPDGYRFESPASVELLGSTENKDKHGEVVKLVFRSFTREERTRANPRGLYGLARYNLSNEKCLEVFDIPPMKYRPTVGFDEQHIWVYDESSEAVPRGQNAKIVIAFFNRSDINAKPEVKTFTELSSQSKYQFHFPYFISRTSYSPTALYSIDDRKQKFRFSAKIPPTPISGHKQIWHRFDRDRLIRFTSNADQKIEYFDAKANTSIIRDYRNNMVGLASTPSGWRIADSFGVTDVDKRGEIQRYQFSRCAIDDPAQTPLDLWITADGKYARTNKASKIYSAVLLRGTRFEVQEIPKFEKEFKLNL